MKKYFVAYIKTESTILRAYAWDKIKSLFSMGHRIARSLLNPQLGKYKKKLINTMKRQISHFQSSNCYVTVDCSVFLHHNTKTWNRLSSVYGHQPMLEHSAPLPYHTASCPITPQVPPIEFILCNQVFAGIEANYRFSCCLLLFPISLCSNVVHCRSKNAGLSNWHWNSGLVCNVHARTIECSNW